MTEQTLCSRFARIADDLHEARIEAMSVTQILWSAKIPAHVAADRMRAIKLLAGRCNRDATEWLKAHGHESWTIEKREDR